jgi:beta-lactamase class A
MSRSPGTVSSLVKLLEEAVDEVVRQLASNQAKPENFAITLLNLSEPESITRGDFRGDDRLYPASVAKLFYFVAVHRWLEDGKIADTDELQRALHDMIVDSSNDATHYVVDLLTDTCSGPELPKDEMAIWGKKRNVINEYFSSLGYADINVNQKVWGDGPYGRERVYLGETFQNRNKLTTNSVARLFSEIVAGQAVNCSRSEMMMDLLQRDITKFSDDPDDQATKFIGKALPPGSKLWSKAGWMSSARHDAAYFELPDGRRFILVIFTVNHGKEDGIVATLAESIISRLTNL